MAAAMCLVASGGLSVFLPGHRWSQRASRPPKADYSNSMSGSPALTESLGCTCIVLTLPLR